MMNLFFDIETYADVNSVLLEKQMADISAPSNYKDPVKISSYIEEQKKKVMSELALSPMTGKIITIGMMDDTGKLFQLSPELDEERMLTKFWTEFGEIFENNAKVKLVSFNGKKFDLPFLLIRTAKLMIQKPESLDLFIPSDYLKKYDTQFHFDLYENHFSAFKGGLKAWASFFLDADYESGAQVAEMYESGRYSEIVEYNYRDLLRTKGLYDSIKHWVGYDK